VTRGEIINNIESKLERLDVHDELTTSALRQEFDANNVLWGINRLRQFEADVDMLLSPYETV
jgi:hypothetical protein